MTAAIRPASRAARGVLRWCAEFLAALLLLLALFTALLTVASHRWVFSAEYQQLPSSTVRRGFVDGSNEVSFRKGQMHILLTTLIHGIGPSPCRYHLGRFLGIATYSYHTEPDGSRRFSVAFSGWWPTGLLLAYPAVHGVLAIRRRWRRSGRGVCSACGYSLVGNMSGRCPECGAATGVHAVDRDASRPEEPKAE